MARKRGRNIEFENENFPKLVSGTKNMDQGTQKMSGTKNMEQELRKCQAEKATPKHMVFKLQKLSAKDKSCKKPRRGKEHLMYI